MNSKQAANKIAEILAQVVSEGATKKQQWNQVYLMLKRIDPSIPKLRFTTGKSFNEANHPEPEPKTTLKPEPKPEGLKDPANEFSYLQGLNVEQIKGWAKMQPDETTKETLVRVAEKLELPTGGKIDDLANSIHEKINAE